MGKTKPNGLYYCFQQDKIKTRKDSQAVLGYSNFIKCAILK